MAYLHNWEPARIRLVLYISALLSLLLSMFLVVVVCLLNLPPFLQHSFLLLLLKVVVHTTMIHLKWILYFIIYECCFKVKSYELISKFSFFKALQLISLKYSLSLSLSLSLSEHHNICVKGWPFSILLSNTLVKVVNWIMSGKVRVCIVYLGSYVYLLGSQYFDSTSQFCSKEIFLGLFPYSLHFLLLFMCTST